MTLYSLTPVPTSLIPHKNESPVHLELLGPTSCCYINPIQAPKIKETLALVAAFFKPSHVIPQSVFSFARLDIETHEERYQQILEIFCFAREVVKRVFKDKIELRISDLVGVIIDTIEDTTLSERKAYSISIILTDKIVKESAKTGLFFVEMNSIP